MIKHESRMELSILSFRPLLVLGIAETDEGPMYTKELFSDSTYADQVHLAEGELSAFIRAVTELFGSKQAKFSTEDWLDESELMDSPPRSTSRDWRAVTVAASARLASRLNTGSHDRSFAVQDFIDSSR